MKASNHGAKIIKIRFGCSYEHLQNASSCSISCTIEHLFDINDELKSHMCVDRATSNGAINEKDEI